MCYKTWKKFCCWQLQGLYTLVSYDCNLKVLKHGLYMSIWTQMSSTLCAWINLRHSLSSFFVVSFIQKVICGMFWINLLCDLLHESDCLSILNKISYDMLLLQMHFLLLDRSFLPRLLSLFKSKHNIKSLKSIDLVGNGFRFWGYNITSCINFNWKFLHKLYILLWFVVKFPFLQPLYNYIFRCFSIAQCELPWN